MHSDLKKILDRLKALPLREPDPDQRREGQTVRERLAEFAGSRIANVVHQPMRNTKAFAAAQEWHVSPEWSLYLHGGVGCGKSVACAWLAQQALTMGAQVLWLSAPSTSRMDVYGAAPSKLARAARRCGLLVVDDLGAELMNSPWLAWLNDVVGARHEHGDRTALTANLNSNEFRARYGDRLADRLKEGLARGSDERSFRQRGGQ